MESSSLVFDPQAGIKKYSVNILIVLFIGREPTIFPFPFFAHILISFMNYRFRLNHFMVELVTYIKIDQAPSTKTYIYMIHTIIYPVVSQLICLIYSNKNSESINYI